MIYFSHLIFIKVVSRVAVSTLTSKEKLQRLSNLANVTLLENVTLFHVCPISLPRYHLNLLCISSVSYIWINTCLVYNSKDSQGLNHYGLTFNNLLPTIMLLHLIKYVLDHLLWSIFFLKKEEKYINIWVNGFRRERQRENKFHLFSFLPITIFSKH